MPDVAGRLIRRAQFDRVKQERDELSQERILKIAAKRGIFEVTWQYRYDWLRERCKKMVRAGLLRPVRGAPGKSYWQITDAGRQAMSADPSGADHG